MLNITIYVLRAWQAKKKNGYTEKQQHVREKNEESERGGVPFYCVFLNDQCLANGISLFIVVLFVSKSRVYALNLSTFRVCITNGMSTMNYWKPEIEFSSLILCVSACFLFIMIFYFSVFYWCWKVFFCLPLVRKFTLLFHLALERKDILNPSPSRKCGIVFWKNVCHLRHCEMRVFMPFCEEYVWNFVSPRHTPNKKRSEYV